MAGAKTRNEQARAAQAASAGIFCAWLWAATVPRAALCLRTEVWSLGAEVGVTRSEPGD